MRKSISLVLVLSMLLAAMLGVTSVAEEPVETPKLEITYANLSFTDSVYPLFAVDYTAVYTGDDAETNARANIKLEVYRNDVLVDTLEPTTEVVDSPVGTIAFKQESFGFKNMGDVYTYCAVNGTDANASDDLEYSVLEYAVMAKATSDDETLDEVVETMLAVGAAAQTAFLPEDKEIADEYDYALADENGKPINYGIVIVGGATAETRKTLAKVGDSVTLVMNGATFPNGAELYGIDFEKADSVVVKDGVSRYFYFGPDIYGDKCGLYSTATDHGSTNLDFDLFNLDSKSCVYDRDHLYTGNDPAKGGYNVFRYKSEVIALGLDTKSGWTSSASGNNNHLSINATPRITDASASNYVGGGIYVNKKDGNGYALIDTKSSAEGCSAVGWELYDNYIKAVGVQTHDPSHFLKDGKFTIGFSLAKKKDVDFSSEDSEFKIYASSTSYVPLFSVAGSSLVCGETKLVDFVEFEGDSPTGEKDYTTFYLVIDVNANTMTVHREDGKSLAVNLDFTNCDQKNMSDFLEERQGMYWKFPSDGGKAYINRITYMVGDIFA